MDSMVRGRYSCTVLLHMPLEVPQTGTAMLQTLLAT
jgi:hypothetical protein